VARLTELDAQEVELKTRLFIAIEDMPDTIAFDGNTARRSPIRRRKGRGPLAAAPSLIHRSS
jgi:hypothetical protein